MNTKVRPPAVAGSFYPARPEELAAMTAQLRAQAEKIVSGIELPAAAPAAAVIPHAGYVYSGVAAMTGLLAAKRGLPAPERAVLIAPSHHVGFHGVAVGDYTALATPVGDLPVDAERQNALLVACDGVLLHNSTRTLAPEHALEVELPLILEAFGAIPVLPAVVGQLYPDDARAAAKFFAPWLDGRTLFVISSDFTHYGADFGYVPFTANVPENLRKLDLAAASAIAAGDVDGFGRFLASTGATVCGAAGIMLAMAALELSGGGEGRAVCYTNSGILTGDYSHCVGYCSMLLYKKAKEQHK